MIKTMTMVIIIAIDDDDDPKRTFIFPSGRALKEARPCPQGDAQKSVALQLGECMAMMHSRSHRW